MILAPGTRLGPYEIIAPLGAGGMGEVFRARDARLGRDVAIKAMPVAFAQDPERLARFEREARLLASLNHPNVAGIHGLEEVEGARYLVLEFVDGETLEARIQRGALALDEVLDVARHVAAGVEAAHEAGVVHRDLKPGNVMLTTTGVVKVLDFGLAKSGPAQGTDSNPNLSASPTMTYAATQAGVILGTAAYMSPEQARGKHVDRRTDIWSFGCVLYECLTGRRAYEGETVSDLVARILEREPDWSVLPATTPPRLVALLKRCLTKDAKQRQRDIGDVRLELEAITTGDTGRDRAAGAAAPTGRKASVWMMGAVGLALLALGATLAGLWAARGTQPRAMALTLVAPPGVSIGRNTTDVLISPDGRFVIFVGSDSLSGPRLWIRSVDRENARALAQTENAEYPFWSPDGRRAGFFAEGKLKTVNIGSGAVSTLADAPLPRGGAWGRSTILYQPRSLGPLWSIPEAGGEPVVATQVDSAAGDAGHRFPQFLPDGRHFIATILGDGSNKVAVGTIKSRSLRVLYQTEGSSGATFAAPGWLVAWRDGAVRAQQFDPRTLRTHGPAIEVPGVRAISPDANGAPIVSASGNGMLLQRAASDLPQRLAIVDRQGRTVGEIEAPEGTYSRGSVSPDGRQVAFEHYSKQSDIQIWVADLVRGGMQPLTLDKASFTPVFSPDSRDIAFTREESSRSQDLYRLRAEVPNSQRLVKVMPNRFNTSLGFSPDGRGVLLRTQGTESRQDLVYVTFGDSATLRVIAGTKFNEPTGSISPDGRWLAYVSDESGPYEVRVRPFPDTEGQVTIVSRGAWAEPTSSTRIGLPCWRADGRELLFVGADGHTLMTSAITPGVRPAFGEPRPLFRLPNSVADMAVSRDLDRFVLSIIREEEGRSGATVLVDWTAMLEGKR